MTLPEVPLPRKSVTLPDGSLVEFHSLSRFEAIHVSTAYRDGANGGQEAAEAFTLARGMDISEDEARAWLEHTDATAAGLVVDGIIYLSGLADPPADPEAPEKKD